MREKLIDIVEAYADFLDWDTKEEMVDSIMEFLATDNNVGHKWIPVTERLPERFVYVLAMTDFGEAAVARLKGNGRWYIGWDNDQYPDITHWMPLPQPPKE